MERKFTIANIITISRLVFLPFIILFLIKNKRIEAFIFMVIALFSDAIDGYLARKFHQETELGKLLDPLCDKISLLVILITLLLINAIPAWAVIVIIIRDILIILGSFILFRRRAVIYKSNILGKATGFLFGAMILAFTLKYSHLGMIFLYISIPVMFGAFVTYLRRYIVTISNK
uniref:CDP-alcohol phosphatidyltransferase family protein n=1 Tax=candidate division WOR-3 bacterium TaxID=2052148 RepID=A0A7C4XAU8_UNCW3